MKLTIDQIVSLSNAGFTKSEIMQVVGMNDSTAPTTPVPTVPTTPTTPVPTAPTTDNDIAAKLDNLTALLQRNAILGTAQPAAPTLQEQADDALLSLILSPTGDK